MKLLEFLPILLFGLLMSQASYWFRYRSRDGWSFEIRAQEIFYFSSSLLLLVESGWPRFALPFLLIDDRYLLMARILLCLFTWSISALLLSARFQDPSALEKHYIRKNPLPMILRRITDWSFFCSLFLLATKNIEKTLHIALAIQGVGLLGAFIYSLVATEWKRLAKRASMQASSYFLSLFVLAAASILCTTAFLFVFHTPLLLVEISLYITLGAGLLRLRYQRRAKWEAAAFAGNIRSTLQQSGDAEKKIQELCRAFQEEWSLARVSLVAVKGQQGRLLASVGPYALPSVDICELRKLGPFLRRTCKERHLLYAPVAEELGTELQESGLRHSSLALPFPPGEEVSAVLCLMAEENMRISPEDALIIHLCGEALAAEVLLLSELAVQGKVGEHLSHSMKRLHGPLWENLEESTEARRVLVRATGLRPNQQPSALAILQNKYRAELSLLWTSLRSSFEFLSIESFDGGFWACSPAEFRAPLLQEIGKEKAALLLAHLMDKHARLLLQQDGYRSLGTQAAQILVGAGTMPCELNHFEFPLLEKLAELNRESGNPGVIVDCVDATLRDVLMSPAFRTGPALLSMQNRRNFPSMLEFPEIRSLLGVSADKQELRKMETVALNLVRSRMKQQKAA